MRRVVLLVAAAVLLAGPTVLAFFSGGYFDEPRLIATLAVWALVVVVAVAAPRPLPASRSGWAALAGLVLITVWTSVTISWAPLSGAATDNLVRLLMYLGAFVAAAALLRPGLVARAVEPALGLGAALVIGYGLAGRLLPGLIELDRSQRAGGRLEQPLTYWNAEGALAAMGLVLCVHIAGSGARPRWLRMLAAAATVPLGTGVYLSYSRGAVVAALIGLLVLLAAAPDWSQLRSAGGAVAGAVLASVVAAVLPGVASLEGSLAERKTDGVVMLLVLLGLMAAVAALQARDGRPGRLPFAGRLPAVAAAAVALGLLGLVAGALGERGDDGPAGEPSRLTEVGSRRYDYWRVALDEYAKHPIGGLGSGGFRAAWRRERTVNEGTLEVHSLPIEMGLELGLPGLLGYLLLVGGVGVAAARALSSGAPLAAGACAAAVVWLIHSTIDWDWQVPAVTLPALLLAGALVAASEREADPAA